MRNPIKTVANKAMNGAILLAIGAMVTPTIIKESVLFVVEDELGVDIDEIKDTLEKVTRDDGWIKES